MNSLDHLFVGTRQPMKLSELNNTEMDQTKWASGTARRVMILRDRQLVIDGPIRSNSNPPGMALWLSTGYYGAYASFSNANLRNMVVVLIVTRVGSFVTTTVTGRSLYDLPYKVWWNESATIQHCMTSFIFFLSFFLQYWTIVTTERLLVNTVGIGVNYVE